MVRIDELTRTHGAARAVDEVTVDVVPGSVTGFLGPNGAGKSTTMRVVMGLDRPTGGRVTVRGGRYAGFMSVTSARLTLAVRATAALAGGGYRLVRPDAGR